MTTVALMIKPIANGWAVWRTDGRELARFRGLFAWRRAVRFAAAAAQ